VHPVRSPPKTAPLEAGLGKAPNKLIRKHRFLSVTIGGSVKINRQGPGVNGKLPPPLHAPDVKTAVKGLQYLGQPSIAQGPQSLSQRPAQDIVAVNRVAPRATVKIQNVGQGFGKLSQVNPGEIVSGKGPRLIWFAKNIPKLVLKQREVNSGFFVDHNFSSLIAVADNGFRVIAGFGLFR
jgi:hypothetical protein